MKLAIALLLLATPAFAQFNYQAHQSPSVYGTNTPRYGYGSGYGYHSYRYLPRREVTTIRPLEGGGTRIETRRYYKSGGTARFKASSGKWSAKSR